MSLSWSALFSILILVRGLADRNEIISIISGGISGTRIFLSIFLFGIFLTFLNWKINHDYIPQVKYNWRKEIAENTKKNPQILFKNKSLLNKSFQNRKYSASKIQDGKIENLHIYEFEKNRLKKHLFAEEAEIIPNKEGINLDLRRIYIENFGENSEITTLFTERIFPWKIPLNIHFKTKFSSLPTPELRKILKQDKITPKEKMIIHKKIIRRSSFSFIFLMALPSAIYFGIYSLTNREKKIHTVLALSLYLLIYGIFITIGNEIQTQNVWLISLLFWLPNLLFLFQGIHGMHRLRMR